MLLFVRSKPAAITAALLILGWGAGAGLANADPVVPAPPPGPTGPPPGPPGPGPKTTMDHDGKIGRAHV